MASVQSPPSLLHYLAVIWPLLSWHDQTSQPLSSGKMIHQTWEKPPAPPSCWRKIWHSQMHFWQQNFWTKYFFFLALAQGYDDVYHAEGHTEVEVSVKQIWKKVSQNLDDGNMPRFFSTLKIFTEVATLVAPGGFSLIVGLHVVHTKIIVWPSQIFLVFFKKFQHDKKYCVNEQWPKK